MKISKWMIWNLFFGSKPKKVDGVICKCGNDEFNIYEQNSGDEYICVKCGEQFQIGQNGALIWL